MLLSVACNPRQPFSHPNDVRLYTALYEFPHMCPYRMVFPGNYRIYFTYVPMQYNAPSPLLLGLWALFPTFISLRFTVCAVFAPLFNRDNNVIHITWITLVSVSLNRTVHMDTFPFFSFAPCTFLCTCFFIYFISLQGVSLLIAWLSAIYWYHLVPFIHFLFYFIGTLK